MLRLEALNCGYGQMRAVQNLDLVVPAGGIMALLGANGAGKTSTLMCIAGHVAVQQGKIIYDEVDITRQTPMQRVKAGIAVVPEGRRLFVNLTVKENLIAGGYSRPRDSMRKGMDRVLTLFPRLGERLGQSAGSLSGGEQQMLAIGRAMMARPKLLLIDELSLGLMPKIIDVCYRAISELVDEGLTILLVEQSTQRALEVANQVCVLESGQAVWQGSGREAKQSSEMIDKLLGLGN